MARPGLEPGTPRFSGPEMAMFFARKALQIVRIRAPDRVSVFARNLRTFRARLGHETPRHDPFKSPPPSLDVGSLGDAKHNVMATQHEHTALASRRPPHREA